MKCIVKRAFKIHIFLIRLFTCTAENFVLLIIIIISVPVLCEQLNEELKQSLKETMTKKYSQKSYDQVTKAVDKLQQEVCV